MEAFSVLIEKTDLLSQMGIQAALDLLFPLLDVLYHNTLDAGGVELSSQPYVYLPTDVIDEKSSQSFSIDLVDLIREEHELGFALEKAQGILEGSRDENPFVVLFDGTLIFWPLEGKSPEVKDKYLSSYLASLHELYQKNIPVASYISFPKSKELVNLIKLGLCRFTIADCIPCHSKFTDFPCKAVDALIDTHVARSFLPEYHRTTLFYSASKIIDYYPDHLKPCFVYIDVGEEIGRIELPRYVAENDEYLDLVCRVVIDQSRKGYGYPVCLAEAHEQAVVKGPDREFFFRVLHKIGMEQNKRVRTSQKSMKKRMMSI